jgi:hypothetical protein
VHLYFLEYLECQTYSDNLHGKTLNCGMSEYNDIIHDKGMNMVIVMKTSLCFKIRTDIFSGFPSS